MTLTEPTEHEKRQAAYRQEMADIERARLVAAMALCPGGKRFGRWVLKDACGVLPDRITYCANYDDGRGWVPTPHDQERRTDHPGYLNPKTGKRSYPFRWSHCFQYIGVPGNTYQPRTAEQLAGLRQTREHRARLRLAADMPLFAEDIIEQRFQVTTKNKLNNARRRAQEQAAILAKT